MARNPTWTRDEIILALELYLRYRERLPDSDDPENVELSRTLNTLFGEQAKEGMSRRMLKREERRWPP